MKILTPITFTYQRSPQLIGLTAGARICSQLQSGRSPRRDVAEKVRQLIQAATSVNTRRAYRSDLAHFLANGGELPVLPYCGCLPRPARRPTCGRNPYSAAGCDRPSAYKLGLDKSVSGRIGPPNAAGNSADLRSTTTASAGFRKEELTLIVDPSAIRLGTSRPRLASLGISWSISSIGVDCS